MLLNCGLEKTLENPLDLKETKSVKARGNKLWIFIGRPDAEAEVPIFGHLMQRANSQEKILMLGKIEGKRKRGQKRVRWLDGITDSTYMKVKVAQSCPTFCNPKDYTAHRILQARILEWVAFPFSRGSSEPRDQTQVSCIAADSLPAEPQGKAQWTWVWVNSGRFWRTSLASPWCCSESQTGLSNWKTTTTQ